MNNKIFVSEKTEEFYISEIYYIVELLQSYGVPNEQINPNALISHFLYEHFRNFAYVGYRGQSNFAVMALKTIGATKHLAYIEEGKSNFKKVAEQEDLTELHKKWLYPLLKKVSFKEKYAHYSKLIGTDIMPVSQEELKSYQFLTDWVGNHKIFDLDRLLSLQCYGELEPYNAYFMFPDSDIDHTKDGVFVSFAADGAGGHYLLWYYPNMKKEPSVVYISSDGEMEFLASSLNEYILSLPNEILDNFEEYIEEYIDYLVEDYNERFDKNINEKEATLLLKAEITAFIKLAKSKLTFKKQDSNDLDLFNKLIEKWEI